LKALLYKQEDKFVVELERNGTTETRVFVRWDMVESYLREIFVGESLSTQLRREFVDAPKPDPAYVRPDEADTLPTDKP
jgi:hypothetical protein